MGQKMMKDTLGVLLAGGAGERLFPLTRDRAKPAVPFGGTYRIIDITLSNCINSELRRVYILTQYKALSLNRHIREGWTGIVAQDLGEFIEILPPMQRVSDELVHGHGRCRLPEHLLDWRGAAEVCADSLRRPHLQDELRHDAGSAQGLRRGRHAGDAAGGSQTKWRNSAWWMWLATATSLASRKSRKRRASVRHSIPRKWTPQWASTSSTRMCCFRR